MFDETYQSRYEYAEVSWAGGLRKAQLEEFARVVHGLSPHSWKRAIEANGFIAGNNVLLGRGYDHEAEFRAYPVKGSPRTVVIRRSPETPLVVQCLLQACRDTLTADFYTLSGRRIHHPVRCHRTNVRLGELLKTAQRLALKTECLKSPMQPVRLVLHGCAFEPVRDFLVWSQEIRRRPSTHRLRRKADMAAHNLRRTLTEDVCPRPKADPLRGKVRKKSMCQRLHSKSQLPANLICSYNSHEPGNSLHTLKGTK